MIDVYDVLGLAGLLMLSAGLFMIDVRLALCLLGTVLLLVALSGARQKGKGQ